MSRFVPALLALIVATLTAACATSNPHVTLERAPTVDAPFNERATYFKEHALQSREHDHVFLHGGQRVYWPEDLLPAVDPGSTTGKAIQEHVEARERVEQWEWLGYTTQGMVAGSTLLMLVGVGALFTPIVAPEHTDLGWVLVGTGLIGGGVLGIGVLGVSMVHGGIVGEDLEDAGEAADRAVRTYPQSLSDRLGVGVSADGVIIDFVKPGAEPPPSSDDGRDI